jgi:hypothetical protein
LSVTECNFDIIILLETNFNEGIYNEEIFDNRFIVYRCDRNSANSTKKDGGGVLMAVNKRLNSELISVVNGDYVEQLWVKIVVGSSSMFFCCVYLPPDCDVVCYERHMSSIEFMYNKCEVNDKMFVCGDYNLPNIRWSEENSLNGSLTPFNVSTPKEILITDGMATCDLSQINNIPNMRDVLLDLFFCNFNDDVTIRKCESPLLPLDIHHSAYEISIETSEIIFEDNVVHAKMFDFKHANIANISNFLNGTDWISLFDGQDADACVEIFYSNLELAIERNVPLKKSKIKSKKNPWYTRELSNLENRKIKAFKSRSGRGKNKFIKLRSEYKKLNRSLYSAWINKIENRIKTDPKQFFDFANYKRKTVGYPSTMSLGPKTSNSSSEVCDLFADFFESVYNDSISDAEESLRGGEGPGFCSLRLEMTDMEIALAGLNVNKGAGDDGIPPSFVKRCADALKTPLLHIFNLSLSSGIFPSKWKNSFLIPIFKAGKRTDIGNYRGVAILSCFAKLFEVLVYSHLFFAVKSVISPSQHGFVAGRSTVTNLIEFTSYILNNMENGVQIDAIYTDFSKAFDKVNHRLLLQKLSAIGFGGNFLKWIASYLTDRKQYVKACGRQSRIFSVNSGVPQGSHLGPLLFLIFINDITHCFKYLRFLLYADDLKVFFPMRGSEDHQYAQTELEALSQWCMDNDLQLNLNKCKIISFSRNRATLNFDYVLSMHSLERVNTIRDLGVLLDQKLDFRCHIEELIVRAARMLGFVRRVGKEFKDPYTLKTLYVSFVRSVLEYAGIIWNPYYAVHANRIEAVQKKFIRFALRTLNWDPHLPLPPYCQRCRLLNMDRLDDRRRLSCVLFINDVLCGNLDSPNILCNIKLNVLPYNTRNRVLLAEVAHRTNYGKNEPLNKAIRTFNEFSDDFEFGMSRCVLKQKLKKRFLRCGCQQCSRTISQ